MDPEAGRDVHIRRQPRPRQRGDTGCFGLLVGDVIDIDRRRPEQHRPPAARLEQCQASTDRPSGRDGWFEQCRRINKMVGHPSTVPQTTAQSAAICTNKFPTQELLVTAEMSKGLKLLP